MVALEPGYNLFYFSPSTRFTTTALLEIGMTFCVQITLSLTKLPLPVASLILLTVVNRLNIMIAIMTSTLNRQLSQLVAAIQATMVITTATKGTATVATATKSLAQIQTATKIAVLIQIPIPILTPVMEDTVVMVIGVKSEKSL